MQVTIRVATSGDGSARSAVALAWGGGSPGEGVFNTNSNGRVRVVVPTSGSFDASSASVTVKGIVHPDLPYLPGLNTAPSSREFQEPDDD